MAALWRAKGAQFFDNSGNPLSGGKLAYFDAGTLSAKTVYQDSDASVPWTQPVVLDSAGRLSQSVYITSGAFKERLRTSADVDIYTEDNIPGDTVLTVSDFARPNMPVLSKSVSYTVLEDDIGSMIQADATGGDVTITLISAVTAGDGAQIGVQNVGSAGRVIVAVPGGQTINGASTIQILKPRAGGVFTSNAGAWSGPVTNAPFSTLTKTTTYTVDAADIGRTIKADASGGAWTVTLPAAADAGDGFEITVVKTDSTTNAVTIDGDGSETINGAANTTLGYQWKSVTVRSDASNWQIVRDSVVGPVTSTDNAIPRFDGTAGAFQTSSVTIGDTGNVSTDGVFLANATSANLLPAGTVAQRPTPTQGHIRENTDANVLEHYTGSAWRMLDRPLLHLQDQKASGTNGGSVSTGSWLTRTLNTEVVDEIGSSLSSDQFTLPAGTYEALILAPAAGSCGGNKAKLRNITDSTDILIGTNTTSLSSGSSISVVSGRFTIAATKTFEVQHRFSSFVADVGFGAAASFSVSEIYADVKVWRIS